MSTSTQRCCRCTVDGEPDPCPSTYCDAYRAEVAATTQDTSMGTVPGTTPGAGALAPAPEVLTIDKEPSGGGGYSLRKLWLPAEKRERESLEYMEKACMRAVGTKRFEPLHTARMAILYEWEETVRSIVRVGGLLHIGAGV